MRFVYSLIADAAPPVAPAVETVAKAKPKRAPMKKAAPPVAPAVETAPPVAPAVETVAKAKPKRASMKKAAPPVAPAVEPVAVEVIEQPAPDAITVTEVGGTEVRQAS